MESRHRRGRCATFTRRSRPGVQHARALLPSRQFTADNPVRHAREPAWQWSSWIRRKSKMTPTRGTAVVRSFPA